MKIKRKKMQVKGTKVKENGFQRQRKRILGVKKTSDKEKVESQNKGGGDEGIKGGRVVKRRGTEGEEYEGKRH